MTPPNITPTHSPVRPKNAPTLSVLIPFYRDNPSDLIGALSAMAGDAIEVLVYDDGTQDPELSRHVSAAIKSCACMATLFTAHENKGRAFGPPLLKPMPLMLYSVDLKSAKKRVSRHANYIASCRSAQIARPPQNDSF